MVQAPPRKEITDTNSLQQQIDELLGEMTLTEKVGQMTQLGASEGYAPDYLGEALRAGMLGSVLNIAHVEVVNELQRIAVDESRLGIPLLVGRDVIHGFKTVMPIPLGQAAAWNPDIVREGARVAALEAATAGVNWTFAPMVDISRDARWGRIAESLGEDAYLTGELAVAMVQGFQGDLLSDTGAIAACAKHFAGYGASESGRDYASTNIPENELRNVYLRPFKSLVDAGVATFMSSFSDLDGVPATANEFLMRQILRSEWSFPGFVVSDWDSVRQLSVHGLTANDREAAFEASRVGIDMEMAGDLYRHHLPSLVESGELSIDVIDSAVTNILRTKFDLGLFDNPYTDPGRLPPIASARAMEASKQAAVQSVVMLKNDNDVLPLSADRLDSIAVIGPLADAPQDQLGTWVFDGDAALSITGIDGIRDLVGGSVEVSFVPVLANSRSRDTSSFSDAMEAARQADAVVMFLGEEAILSGEAHCRADIDLPGAQVELVREVRRAGKPVVAVVLAGRPLTLTNIVDEVDAIFYAWHPGTMGGVAIAELLFGVVSPSGKLPVTFPRMVGQIPIYYNQKNTGKPPRDEEIVHIDDIDAGAEQTSLGMSAFHLDAGYKPLFAFGHGLSYAAFGYDNITVSSDEIRLGEKVTISANLTNHGSVIAEEVVQLYIRDLVGSVTRPVRELKGFKRVKLQPAESQVVNFELHTDDLAFYGRDRQLRAEPGEFEVWIGGSSEADLGSGFRLV